MSPRLVRAIGASLLILVVGGIAMAKLGGGDDTDDRVDAAQTYAAQVARVSTATGNRLAELSDRSDYRKAAAAAESTRAYATSINGAAAQLRAATPPGDVRALHDSLVKLYEQTATSLGRLASRFAQAGDPVELAAGAQELSTQIQQYSTQEHELRDAIERALVQATTPGG
ncbi:MAG: hypothetical protein J7513_14450 [Solirubrobacteraceae bacterium]|nr:hypothetical protein [Solirubrobacteraceae bacterium]